MDAIDTNSTTNLTTMKTMDGSTGFFTGATSSDDGHVDASELTDPHHTTSSDTAISALVVTGSDVSVKTAPIHQSDNHPHDHDHDDTDPEEEELGAFLLDTFDPSDPSFMLLDEMIDLITTTT